MAYVYFTSLPKIERREDLNRIGMASDGEISFQTTSDRPVEDVLRLTVYRESTAGRANTIEIEVPSAYLAPPHLYFHPCVSLAPAYDEIVGSEIFRVGLIPGATLPISRGRAAPAAANLKRFGYTVLGDTSDVAGLAAPYDEEDTRQVMHHERLDHVRNLFQFWLTNANSDQVSGCTFEVRALEPAGTGPTNPGSRAS